jgi:hypothetical protein
MIFVFKYGKNTSEKPLSSPQVVRSSWNTRLDHFTCAAGSSALITTSNNNSLFLIALICVFALIGSMTKPAKCNPISLYTNTNTNANSFSNSSLLQHHYSPWLPNKFVDDFASTFANTFSSPIDSKCHEPSTTCVNRTRVITSPSHDDDSIATRTHPVNGTTSVHASTSSAPTFLDTIVYFNQCLALDGRSAFDICDSMLGWPRERQLEHFHLKYCHRYPLANVLSNSAWDRVVHTDRRTCEQVLSELVMLDKIVHTRVCEYESILARYDCQVKYSVKWSCQDCRVSAMHAILLNNQLYLIKLLILFYLITNFILLNNLLYSFV